jgi:hypothetical protein
MDTGNISFWRVRELRSANVRGTSDAIGNMAQWCLAEQHESGLNGKECERRNAEMCLEYVQYISRG